MFLIWLCKAKKDTGESMASRLLAHNLTTWNSSEEEQMIQVARWRCDASRVGINQAALFT